MSNVETVVSGLRTLAIWALKMAIKAETSEALDLDGRQGLVLPIDRKFEDLTDKIAQREQFLYDLEEKRGLGPRRIEAVEEAQTLTGFCELVNRHKGATTIIDAELDERGNPRFVAKIDYHGASDGISGPLPRWVKHKVVYCFPFSRQFKAWVDAAQWMDKKTFLEWTDKHYIDVADPSEITQMGSITEHYFKKVMAAKKGWSGEQRKAATLGAVFGKANELIDGARKMNGTTQESVEETIDEDGNVQVTYKKSEQVHNATMNRHYLIDLRVFEGDETLRVIPARLFTAVERGQLTLRMQLEGIPQIVEAAFEDAQKRVQEATGLRPIRKKA